MFRALNTAASGMIAQQMNLDNIANNLANASTAGFRARRLQFQDLLIKTSSCPARRLRSRRPTAAACKLDWEHGLPLPR